VGVVTTTAGADEPAARVGSPSRWRSAVNVPAGPAGRTRYLRRSAVGAGRDFAVLEPATEERLFLVDCSIERD